jgi:hypothetical protein
MYFTLSTREQMQSSKTGQRQLELWASKDGIFAVRGVRKQCGEAGRSLKKRCL